MAMDTAQKRYSAMNPMMPWRKVAVVPTGTIGGNVRQAIAFLYSGISAQAGIVIAYVQDMNTRLHVYLCAYYSVAATNDNTVLTQRYLRGLTGNYNARFHRLMRDATDAMP